MGGATAGAVPDELRGLNRSVQRCEDLNNTLRRLSGPLNALLEVLGSGEEPPQPGTEGPASLLGVQASVSAWMQKDSTSPDGR